MKSSLRYLSRVYLRGSQEKRKCGSFSTWPLLQTLQVRALGASFLVLSFSISRFKTPSLTLQNRDRVALSGVVERYLEGLKDILESLK